MFSKNLYLKEVAIIFLVIGVLHLWRAISSWPMNIGSWVVPIWASYVAGIILLLLSWKGFYLSKGE